VDKTIPKKSKKRETKAKNKIITIKYFDTRNKELGDIEITVSEEEEEATMNVDSLKELIPKNVCNITKALFLNNTIRYPLTKEPINLNNISDIELICDVPTPSPTPIPPSVTPIDTNVGKEQQKTIATATPQPTSTPALAQKPYISFLSFIVILGVLWVCYILFSICRIRELTNLNENLENTIVQQRIEIDNLKLAQVSTSDDE
jgi:hypothetical protein